MWEREKNMQMTRIVTVTIPYIEGVSDCIKRTETSEQCLGPFKRLAVS